MISRQMHLLGRGNRTVNPFFELAVTFFQTSDLITEINSLLVSELLQLINLLAHLHKRRFKGHFSRHLDSSFHSVQLQQLS
ncbi:hypothetical protein D3C72_380940 [compost metagenome]